MKRVVVETPETNYICHDDDNSPLSRDASARSHIQHLLFEKIVNAR